MKSRYTTFDLKNAFGEQHYVILDNKYKQQLANHPLVKNLWTIGHFFVIVANMNSWRTELVSGDSLGVAGYTQEEVESRNAEFLMNFTVAEDIGFNIRVTNLVIQYIKSRPPEERNQIFAVYFYRARRKDGKQIMVQHQAIPIYFDQNSIPFIFSNIITDITYLGSTKMPHALNINRSTNEVFHIEPEELQLIKAPEIFSAREREVMQLMLKGYNSRLIGEKLFISQQTVKTHRKNILKKADLNSTVELLGYAITRGII